MEFFQVNGLACKNEAMRLNSNAWLLFLGSLEPVLVSRLAGWLSVGCHPKPTFLAEPSKYDFSQVNGLIGKNEAK